MNAPFGEKTRVEIARLMLALERRGVDDDTDAILPRGVSACSMEAAGTLDAIGIDYDEAIITLREMIAIGHAEPTQSSEARGGGFPESGWVGLTEAGRQWATAEKVVEQSRVDALAVANGGDDA